MNYNSINSMEQFEIALNKQNDEKRKPGRPVLEGSVRQQRLKAMMERAEANGGQIKLGRPVVPNSPRQQRIAEQQEKIANGYIPKRGRPKMVKVETPTLS
jgi:hypothetical protein